MSTAIEWADETWNPIVAFDRDTGKRGWFCVHASTGCLNCYAEAMNGFRGNGHMYRVGDQAKVRIDVLDSVLAQPLHWRNPRRVFVCSMTDLFLDAHTDAMIDRVFATMAQAPRHAFQVLTKRADRMRTYVAGVAALKPRERSMRFARSMYEHHPMRDTVLANLREENCGKLAWPLPNVWLGVSVENQKAADARLPELLQTPAAIRWMSGEPLLEAVDISLWLEGEGYIDDQYVAPLDWVVVGGESGREARPFDVAWARAIVEQCKANDVSVFVKQLGAKPYDSVFAWKMLGHQTVPSIEHAFQLGKLRFRDRHGGDPSEWPDDLRIREYPRVEAAA